MRRSELKYLISNQEYQALFARLKHILPRDKNAKTDEGYFVRSLYFDSQNNRSLREKSDGALVRKKYRIRIYDFDAAEVCFEIKHKINGQSFKERATISRDSAKQVIKGDYADLLNYNNEILNRIYADFILGNYRPKLIVDYYRDAFEIDFFNIRITVDKNICSSGFTQEFFTKNLPMVPLIFENKRILEIKFNQVLPDYIREILQIKSFEKTSFSKYAVGRKFNL